MSKIVTLPIQRFFSSRFYSLYLFLIIILIASFTVRVYNLNYNSAFNDEAIYIVLGNLVLFEGDFWTYNAASWMGGSTYLYPIITSLAYASGGIVESRLVNVVLGVLAIEMIFHIALMSSRLPDNLKVLSGLIAAALMGGAAVSIYISRLATYDMPAFFFFIVSMISFLKAQEKDSNAGKWYFLAAIFLALSVLTKLIILLYVPFLIIYSYIKAKKVGPEKLFFWKRYFVGFLVVGLLFYFLLFWQSILEFTQLQLGREKADMSVIIEEFLDNTAFAWVLTFPAAIGYILSRQQTRWVLLLAGALIIPIFHLITQRVPSLDKHSYLSLFFVSLIVAEGLSQIIYNVLKIFKESLAAKAFIYSGLVAVFICFWMISFDASKSYNTIWPNSNSMLNFLSNKVKDGDLILSESGADVILKNYYKNFPANTTTFDFFEYANYEGDEAYAQAARDGYFKYIELENNQWSKLEHETRISQLVSTNMEDNYNLVFNQDGFMIYERKF